MSTPLSSSLPVAHHKERGTRETTAGLPNSGSPPTLAAMRRPIVITGGQGGLARAIAETFANDGEEVVAPSRQELDVRNAAAVEEWFGRIAPPDFVIAAAGITRDVPLARLSEADWDDVFAVNLHGAMRCAKAAALRMKEAGGGHVVLISSFSALLPPVGQAAYAAAKAALHGLASSLAREWGEDNIRVNVVLPGFLDTRMTAQVSPERRELVRREHVLQRFNTPEAVAGFLLHLHRHLPHTSGQIFQLDSRIAS